MFAAGASWLLLQAPAIWNGFPLLQWDTGGYLARWYEGTLVPSRAVVYGLILNAGAVIEFWPVVALQAAVTVWVIALILRTHGLGGRPWLLLGIVATLSILTTLPWLTSILLTDIFCGLGVLALYLVVMGGDTLRRWERMALIVLAAVSAATHSATLAVQLAILAAGVVIWPVSRARVPLAGIARGIVALALGAVMVVAADFAVAGRLAWTPGGFALSFGRMLQDGIVARYLNEHCPDPALRLCAYKDRLPRDADVWFWGSELFDRLGRFAGLGPEMQRIALESLADYPGMQLETAALATARQLIDVHTGEGVLNSIWHTYAIIEAHTPWAVPAMRAARQQKSEISFDALNIVDWPIGLLSMALLPVIFVAASRRKEQAPLGDLAAAVALAILANAFVCGALSNPHDRYGARIVWLASLVVVVAAARLVLERIGPASDLT
ncbi:MAG TPA: hypothetical protein VFL51_00395 [Pseudolabrys sp.]|nr:hypothetical protein [Pseudolabrys sp.]